MKHLVLGNGNLGTDLKIRLSLHKRNVVLGSKHKFQGFEIDNDALAEMVAYEPDVLWCTIGAGGPQPHNPYAFPKQLMAHTIVPYQIMRAFRNTKTKMMFFSTHYLNQDPEGKMSEYARTKALMEETCRDPNVIIFRVGSLYGVHKPMTTLPGKITGKFYKGEPVCGVTNMISPSPTAWLAKTLVEEASWDNVGGIYTAGPSDECTINEWIDAIAGSYRESGGGLVRVSQSAAVDRNYPKDSSGDLDTGPTWNELWNAYGPSCVRAALEEIKAQKESAPGSSRNQAPHQRSTRA